MPKPSALDRAGDALADAVVEERELRDAIAEADKARSEAEHDRDEWKQIASDNAGIVDAARAELARWDGVESMTAHDAFTMREAFRRALAG